MKEGRAIAKGQEVNTGCVSHAIQCICMCQVSAVTLGVVGVTGLALSRAAGMIGAVGADVLLSWFHFCQSTCTAILLNSVSRDKQLADNSAKVSKVLRLTVSFSCSGLVSLSYKSRQRLSMGIWASPARCRNWVWNSAKV